MKMRKILTMVAALALTAALAIGGTLAYLTANTKTVTNTFTVGDINMTITETGATQDAQNVNNLVKDYKIVPGTTASKDPKITIVENSEKCYVFACVTNTVKLDDTVVATPNISADDWQVVATDGDKTLYLYVGDGADENNIVDAASADVELYVFTEVEYSDTINKDNIDDLEDTQIIVQGYAHQSDGTTYDDVLAAAKVQFGITTASAEGEGA